jgi:hypothetical protein
MCTIRSKKRWEQFESSPSVIAETGSYSVAPKMAGQHQNEPKTETPVATETPAAREPATAFTEEPVQNEPQSNAPAGSGMNIEQKIKNIIMQNPTLGTGQIKKMLNTPQYGNVRMGWFQVRGMLKAMGLNSKSRRFQFFNQNK